LNRPPLGLQGTLPADFAHKERAQRLNILGSLLGFSHILDEARERMELRAYQAQDKLIVILVEPETGQTNIERMAALGVGFANHRVLAENLSLLHFSE